MNKTPLWRWRGNLVDKMFMDRSGRSDERSYTYTIYNTSNLPIYIPTRRAGHTECSLVHLGELNHENWRKKYSRAACTKERWTIPTCRSIWRTLRTLLVFYVFTRRLDMVYSLHKAERTLCGGYSTLTNWTRTHKILQMRERTLCLRRDADAHSFLVNCFGQWRICAQCLYGNRDMCNWSFNYSRCTRKRRTLEATTFQI